MGGGAHDQITRYYDNIQRCNKFLRFNGFLLQIEVRPWGGELYMALGFALFWPGQKWFRAWEPIQSL